MIETIKRCSICKREDCNGTEFVVPEHSAVYGSVIPEKTVCSYFVQPENGQFFFHEVYGHGMSEKVRAFPKEAGTRWIKPDVLPEYDLLVLVKTDKGILTGAYESDAEGDHWVFGNRNIVWDDDFNLDVKVLGWRKIEEA